MITVVCVWVQGNVPFTAEYVYRLRQMVDRSIGRSDWRFVCLTDRPEQLGADIECIRIPRPNGFPGWWSKLQIFNPEHRLRGPGLYLDLDTLLVSDISPIANYAAKIAFVPHAGDWNGRKGLKVVKKYNSSVMKFTDLGAFPELYTKWHPAVAQRLWGDQDWIGEQLPDERTMPLEWFPRVSEINLAQGPDGIPPYARVVLVKKPKNHEIALKWPWFKQVWG